MLRAPPQFTPSGSRNWCALTAWLPQSNLPQKENDTVTWHVCGLTRAGFLDALDMVTPLCMIRWHAHRSGRSQCAGGNGSSLAAALQRTPGTHRRSGRLRWPWMREAVRPRRCKMAVVTRAGPKRRGGGRLVPAPASRASQQRDG